MVNGVAMAGLCGTSTTLLLGSPVNNGNSLNESSNRVESVCPNKFAAVVARAGSSDDTPAMQSRRSMLSLLAATIAGTAVVNEARSDARSVKLEPPPPLSGGLPGTDNADQARDTDLPLRERFFIQALSPVDAAQRAKFSAQDIKNVKPLIDKKAWPFVQNGLRSSAGYLRYDLNTVIASKPKEERKSLKAVSAKLFDSLNALDYAARSKNTKDAQKYYSETVTLLNDVLSKIA